MRRIALLLTLSAAGLFPAFLGACAHTVSESDKTTTNPITGTKTTDSTTVKQDALGNESVDHEVHKSN